MAHRYSYYYRSTGFNCYSVIISSYLCRYHSELFQRVLPRLPIYGAYWNEPSFEQIFAYPLWWALAYYFIDRGLHLAAGGATFATFPGVLAGLLVLIYFTIVNAMFETQMLAQQNPNAIGESNGTVVKRLFSLAIPVSMAVIFASYGITY